MREPLILPMMMYGKFRRERAKRDEQGNTIIKKRDKKGKPVYETEKYWLVHSKKNGDKGVYPSVNHIYTRMAKGRQKLTAPAEALKEEWRMLAYQWAEENNWECVKDEKVVIELVAYFPDDRIRRDTNNVFKLLMDAFIGILYEDDEYALPRVMDFDRVEKEVEPHFVCRVYKKDESLESMNQPIE